MHYLETCSIKINLSLRVLKRREDGYHDIHSLFWRKRSPEVLELVYPSASDGLAVHGADIPGENILARARRYLRSLYGDDALRAIDLRLFKHLPMGSGVGAGSGNAAALLAWFDRLGLSGGLAASSAAVLGADVAFLASRYDLAFADGLGELLQGLGENLDMPAVLLFPEWTSNTAREYAILDEQRGRPGAECDIIDAVAARAESAAILRRLKSGDVVGMLPNDFVSCTAPHEAQYRRLYDTIEAAGAVAWGLCGSGSASFALFDKNGGADAIAGLLCRLSDGASSYFSWLYKTLVLE